MLYAIAAPESYRLGEKAFLIMAEKNKNRKIQKKYKSEIQRINLTNSVYYGKIFTTKFIRGIYGERKYASCR